MYSAVDVYRSGFLNDIIIELGQGKAYLPERRAVIYYHVKFGYPCDAYQFLLTSQEQDIIKSYVNSNSGIWRLVDYNVMTAVENYNYSYGNKKMDFSSISVEDTYCCIITTRNDDWIGELIFPAALFLWDSCNAQYYCFYISGR